MGDPIRLRADELEARPRVVADARGFVELARKSANAWPSIKPWINATDIQGLLTSVSALCRLICLSSALLLHFHCCLRRNNIWSSIKPCIYAILYRGA